MTTLAQQIKDRLKAQRQQQGAAADTQEGLQDIVVARGGKDVGATPRASAQGAQLAAAQVQSQADQALQGLNLAEETQRQQQELAQAKVNEQRQSVLQSTDEALADISAQQQEATANRVTAKDLAFAKLDAGERRGVESKARDFARQKQDILSEAGIAEDRLFAQLLEAKDQLETDQFLAALDQRAQDVSLANKEYLAELNRVAAEQDVNDVASFKSELQDTLIGEKTSLLKEKYGDEGWVQALDQEARAEKIRSSNMSYDAAIDILKDDFDAAILSAVVGGGIRVGSAVAKEDE